MLPSSSPYQSSNALDSVHSLSPSVTSGLSGNVLSSACVSKVNKLKFIVIKPKVENIKLEEKKLNDDP